MIADCRDVAARLTAAARRLVASPTADLDTALRAAIAGAGQAMRADRAWLYRFSDDRRRADCSDEWCAADVPPANAAWFDVDIERWPIALGGLANGRPLDVPNVAALPDDARGERVRWRLEGRRSVCGRPIRAEGVIRGAFGFDWLGPVSGPSSVDEALEIFGEAIGNAIARLRLAASADRFTLARAGRLESIGRLAGGIAHDFNNLILAILSYAELGRCELDDDSDAARDAFDGVSAAARRAAALTRQLLSFDGDGRTSGPVELDAAIRDALGLLRRIIRATIEIEFAPGASGATVAIDRAQVEQIVVNLCANAQDAVRGHGRVCIRTRLLRDAETTHVALSVEDTGHGMPPEVRRRAFEPFFTTRGGGGGTGLGLSTVSNIAIEAGGRVDVASEPGVGSAFTITLPAVANPDRQRRRVIVSESDSTVRRLARRILERAGFDAIAVDDADGARREVEAEPDTVDAVVLDADSEPERARRTAAELRARWPVLPVVIAASSGAVARARHLPKPWTRLTLLEAVERAIDEPCD